MYNDDIRRKKWQKGKFGIPFDMVPYKNKLQKFGVKIYRNA